MRIEDGVSRPGYKAPSVGSPMPVSAASSVPSYEQKNAFEGCREDSLLDFPPSPSPTFIGRRHTPHTPRLEFLITPALEAPGGGP